MRHFGLDKPGMRIGVVGLGGLGHMAVKFGKAFGCHVTVISTSPAKEHEATKVLGADAFLISKDAEAMAVSAGSDLIWSDLIWSDLWHRAEAFRYATTLQHR